MKLTDYVKLMGIDLRESESVPTIAELRVVTNEARDELESLDEDTEIMDVPLRLKEACEFSFEKHIDAIVAQETAATQEHQRKYTKLNMAQENSREYDRRYKERPGNRTRFK